MNRERYMGIRKTLADAIKGTEWENHVYLVGGCCRDDIMGEEIHDIDIAIDMPNGGVRFAQWLHDTRRTPHGRKPLIFEHFGTAKVRLRDYPDDIIDCVQTRKDRYVYEENPDPEKNFGTIDEDALRRDLTINSLYINISTNELLDPTGKGIADIGAHVIRTPNIPDISLNDNPMHILRVIRFSVKFGWKIDKNLFECMKRNVAIIGESTPRRLYKELKAIRRLKRLDVAMKLIEETGAMPYVTPMLELIAAESRDKRAYYSNKGRRHGQHKGAENGRSSRQRQRNRKKRQNTDQTA